MNTSVLSDRQLIQLHLNCRLDKAILEVVYEELMRRDKDFEQTPIYLSQKVQRNKAVSDPLPGKYKTGLLLLPLIFPVYLAVKAIARCEVAAWKARFVLFLFLPGGLIGHYGINQYLAEGRIKRWRAYWTWLSLGYVLWMILLIIGAGFYFQNIW